VLVFKIILHKIKQITMYWLSARGSAWLCGACGLTYYTYVALRVASVRLCAPLCMRGGAVCGCVGHLRMGHLELLRSLRWALSSVRLATSKNMSNSFKAARHGLVEAPFRLAHVVHPSNRIQHKPAINVDIGNHHCIDATRQMAKLSVSEGCRICWHRRRIDQTGRTGCRII